jgi:hypothetical protein
MHATNLLKERGRIGMIISKMWLQTDYGISFGKFLLDHYRIVALIDLSYRLFEAPISTVILLAEKERDANRSAREVQSYTRWGETECRTRIRGTRGGGRLASEAKASKARQRVGLPLFYDLYDLGDYILTPIMIVYQAFYHPQFFLCKMPIVTYHAVIAFVPKVKVETSFMKYARAASSSTSLPNLSSTASGFSASSTSSPHVRSGGLNRSPAYR